MENNTILKKKLLYRATHRGTKEMDLLLGNFVKININKLSLLDLKQLEKLLNFEDEYLFNILFKKRNKIMINNAKIYELLKKFRI
jgi:succinate dehydrogenase flavin-adding protein (antitoxin of CptAB toxin-antitoxin module)